MSNKTPLYKKWSNCKRCGLHRLRKHVVIGRGPLPCDILCIGEAPGKSENLNGIPFCGPAGTFQRKIIRLTRGKVRLPHDPAIYYTNVIACRPCDTRNGSNRQPTVDEALACMDRIREIYSLAQPKVVVLVGSFSDSHLGSIFPEAMRTLHPSFLLKGGAEGSPFITRYMREWMLIFHKLRLCLAKKKGVIE